MTEGGQRVVIIQDASGQISSSAIVWILEGFSLKFGDEIRVIAVLQQITNSTPFSFIKSGKFSKVENAMGGVRQRIREEERAKKEEEYLNNLEILKITKLCETKKVEFRLVVHMGPSRKQVAVKAARNFNATWVILDRRMKKYKNYFMERLSCGVSRMKHNNTILELRGPRPVADAKSSGEQSIVSNVKYEEMIPGNTDEETSTKCESPAYTSLGTEQEVDGSSDPSWNTYRNFASVCKFLSGSKRSPSRCIDEQTTTTTSKQTARENKRVSPTNEENKIKQQVEADWGVVNYNNEEFKNSTCSYCKNRRPKIGWKRDFTYAELHAATNGFSEKNFLSEGGFGSVFRGNFNGLEIAVKQHKNASCQGEKEFKSEVNVLSRVRHENLVMLLGSCSQGSHRLLVYEFVCNGSLDQHLSNNKKRTLSWEKRMKIARGTAKGLQYLHHNNIIHRDMRPNNILITHDHESLLGDFGLAKTQSEDSELSLSDTRVVGTLGYLAPEYAEFGKVSTKTDVYAFGVVLLQLITGLTTTDKILGGKSLVGWARPLLKERNYPDLIDKRIGDTHDVHQLFWMVQLAEKCLRKDPHKRSSMDKVMDYLNYMMDGNSFCGIRDFSPPESDGLSNIPESTESPDECISFTIETTLTCSLNQRRG